MTFNRYITLRMFVELIGGVACSAQMLYEGTITGLIVTTVVAVFWIAGQLCVVTILRRESPRTDELSDDHQNSAFRFAFFALIAALMIFGFAGMILPLLTHTPFDLSPMLLPTLTMFALALADARYLWLENSLSNGDDDED